mmetsp:Transcript_22757/g.33006  ORF Transcript_22757/g.33006 Transcript_22757/m.33006 type:complete len:566 (-) Transcript_22757:2569-4266(-)
MRNLNLILMIINVKKMITHITCTALLLLASLCISPATTNNAFFPANADSIGTFFPSATATETANHYYGKSIPSKKEKKEIQSWNDNKRPSIFQTLAQNYTNIDTLILDYGGQHPFELYQQRQLNTQNEKHDKQQQQQHRNLNNIFDFEANSLRIFTDTSHIESTVNTTPGSPDIIRYNLLVSDILPNVVSKYSQYLAVRRRSSSLITVPLGGCFGIFQATDEYEGISRELVDGIENTDFVLLVSQFEFVNNKLVCPMEGTDGETMAAATFCSLDQFDRPTLGFVNICLNKIKVEDDGTITQKTVDNFVGVLIREFAQALGLNSESFKYFRDVQTGEPLTQRPFQPQQVTCVDEKNIFPNIVLPSSKVIRAVETSRGNGIYYEVVTSQVRQVVRNQFNCQEMTGAKLDTGSSCFGTHFEERFYYAESQSAIFAEEANYFSALTLAFFEDTGWYVPNYRAAKASPFGHGVGCDFVKDCIVNGNVPDYSKGFFCNKIRDNVSTGVRKNDYMWYVFSLLYIFTSRRLLIFFPPLHCLSLVKYVPNLRLCIFIEFSCVVIHPLHTRHCVI